MTDRPRVAQPTRVTRNETWELEMVERVLFQEFSDVSRREVEDAVNAALGRMEPIRRRQLVPQLVRDDARRDLHGRCDKLTRPMVRPLTTPTRGGTRGDR